MVNNEENANKTDMYLGKLNIKANEISKYERINLEQTGISVEYTHLFYVFNVMVLEPLGTIRVRSQNALAEFLLGCKTLFL
jgi:hypothetical protein